MKFNIIVAIDENRGIGFNNNLPWKIAADMKYFKELTIKTKDPSKVNAVIMGRKTWDSIPERFRPLLGRLNIVMSESRSVTEINTLVAKSFADALMMAELGGVESCFVIGGGQIYEEAIKHNDCESLYITEVAGSYSCDTNFPLFTTKDYLLSSTEDYQVENNMRFRFAHYVKT